MYSGKGAFPFRRGGLLPVIVVVMPIMMVMMLVVILYAHHDLGLRCHGYNTTENEQSEQKHFHNIFYRLL